MKNMVMISILGIFLILISISQNNEDFEYRKVYSIDSVRTEIQDRGSLRLFITATVPDPCYEFAHADLDRTDSLITITPVTKRDKKMNCIQILAKIDFTIEISRYNNQTIMINTLGTPSILKNGE